MSSIITFEIKKISELADYVKELLVTEYKLTAKQSEVIIAKHFKPYIETLNKDLYTLIEVPYVDKIYRDSFYNYYSSKLGVYHRDCCRISFFNSEIKPDDFRNKERQENFLSEHYLGFLVIRPTFPKIIGRTALSPKAKKDNNIVCALANIRATVNGVKTDVNSFPHSSQDNQTMTCAETTVWSLLEYFGNKYPEYKPVLPSTITRILHKFSYKRLLPSDGLTAEQVTYAVRELGFGAMIYSQKKYGDDFHAIISSYVESGIPVIGVLKNQEIGHAINIVGRVKDDKKAIAESKDIRETLKGAKYIDYNKQKRGYVFIDDNYPPYQIASLNSPCKEYYLGDSRWHTCEITNIIVPLYHKIYLDAARARKNFYKLLDNSRYGVLDKEVRVTKIFLASSRSYKNYIAVSKDLHRTLKELILRIPMPKFVWVGEISKLDSFVDGKCDSILIQDATEPLEYSDKTMISNPSIIGGYSNGRFFTQNLGNFAEKVIFAPPFETYRGNLK